MLVTSGGARVGLSPPGKFSEATETRFSGSVRDGLGWAELTREEISDGTTTCYHSQKFYCHTQKFLVGPPLYLGYPVELSSVKLQVWVPIQVLVQ